MLIDNSVVILEAIARRKDAGLSTIDAAREGTAEVATAVTASTLTSVAVFFPMVFVSGIAGQLFRDQALTVTFAQLISLMVGITLVPMLTAWRARLGDKEVALADDAGEPREAVSALTNYLRVLGENFRVTYIVRVPDDTRSVLRRIWRWITYALRFLVTFLVRVARIFFGLLGKLFAVLLSPAVWFTQTSYNVPRPALSGAARLGTGAPRRGAVHGLRPARRHGTDPSEPRQRADTAAVAGRIHREDAAAGRLAAGDHRPPGAVRECRGARSRESRQRLRGRRFRQSARCESGRLG